MKLSVLSKIYKGKGKGKGQATPDSSDTSSVHHCNNTSDDGLDDVDDASGVLSNMSDSFPPFPNLSRRSVHASIGATPPLPTPPPSKGPSADAPTATATSVLSAPRAPVETLRHVCERNIRNQFPTFIIRDDFDRLELGTVNAQAYKALEGSQLRAELDFQRKRFTKRLGGKKKAMARLSGRLDRVAEVTGRKPVPGEPGILTFVIPGSQYALRIWPGSFARREYCVDFVYADAIFDAINTPSHYKLFAQLPDKLEPWLTLAPRRIYSLERLFGLSKEEMKPGAEKYVFRDGLKCILSYPDSDEPLVVEIPIRSV